MSEDWIAEITSSPWTVLVAAILAGLVLGRVFVMVLRPAIARFAARSDWEWDDALVAAIGTPLSLLLAVQGLNIASPWLPLDARGQDLLDTGVAVVTTWLALWTAFRAVDVVVAALGKRAWAIERSASRSLLGIAGRLFKVLVVVIALIVVLAYLGVSVASLIAGLGIGGLALALAAQKTVENLFGTLSIGVDQPLHEGDFVKVGDHLGTVEAIGLRSTRIRTLDRTLVTVPNGQLADERIECYTVRDRIRLATILGLVYQTSASQIREILAGVEGVLRAHPKIWPDTVVVRFQKFGESSLDVEVMAWFQTSDWNEFMEIRQEILLAFMEVIERAGSSLAYPTRTLHVAPPAQSPI
jgi:MscS family membrane protein